MFLGDGHVYILRSADGGTARIQTNSYISTEGLCIEVYYWVEELGTLQLVLIGEDETDQNRTNIASRTNQWSWFYTVLPKGIFLITLDGSGPSSWVVIDDVRIDKCSEFGKFFQSSVNTSPLCLLKYFNLLKEFKLYFYIAIIVMVYGS